MKTVYVDTRVEEDGKVVETHNISIPLFESAGPGEVPWEIVAAKVGEVSASILEGLRAVAGEGSGGGTPETVYSGTQFTGSYRIFALAYSTLIGRINERAAQFRAEQEIMRDAEITPQS